MEGVFSILEDLISNELALHDLYWLELDRTGAVFVWWSYNGEMVQDQTKQIGGSEGETNGGVKVMIGCLGIEIDETPRHGRVSFENICNKYAHIEDCGAADSLFLGIL